MTWVNVLPNGVVDMPASGSGEQRYGCAASFESACAAFEPMPTLQEAARYPLHDADEILEGAEAQEESKVAVNKLTWAQTSDRARQIHVQIRLVDDRRRRCCDPAEIPDRGVHALQHVGRHGTGNRRRNGQGGRRGISPGYFRATSRFQLFGKREMIILGNRRSTAKLLLHRQPFLPTLRTGSELRPPCASCGSAMASAASASKVWRINLVS
jgi:hypothetical protein